MKQAIVLANILLITILSFGQIDSTDNGFIKEQLLEESISDNEESELHEIFEDLEANPINLNTAEISDLLKIPFIDLNSAKVIIDYRTRTYKFFSKAELYNIKELDSSVVDNSLPFLTINDDQEILNKKGLRNIFSIDFRTRYLEDLNPTLAEKNLYPGKRFKNYNRIKLDYKQTYQFGFLTEKDPGETKLVDFSSMFFCIKDIGILRKLVVGDYLVEFGQGLSLWSPYGFSKGANIRIPVNKANRNLIPYTSSDENNFFRGAAATIGYHNIELTSFYSSKYIDASIDTISDQIKSLLSDGYHRTTAELSHFHSVKEISAGGRIDWRLYNILTIGFITHYHRFNLEFGSALYNKPQGNKFLFNSFYYQFLFKNFLLVGETAQSGSSIANIHSLQISISKFVSLIFSARFYPKNYVSFHTHAFGENSGNPQNEIGVYSGLQVKSILGNIGIYYDQFKYPGPSFYNPLPAAGNEFFLNYSVSPIRKTELNFRYKNETKEIAGNMENKKITVNRTIKSYKMQMQYKIFKELILRERFDFQEYILAELKEYENGFCVYQDVIFNSHNNLFFSARIIFFQTDSYKSRVYEFENDLSGVMSNSVLYGDGTRWYLLIKYSLTDFMKLSIKYSETSKPNEKVEEDIFYTTGRTINRLSLQLDLKL